MITGLIKKALLTVFVLYVGALVLLYFLQDGLVFPVPNVADAPLPPNAEFVEMRTADGTTLRHVRFRADEGAPKLMFFHGNGSLASFETDRGALLHEMGFDVLLVEYRGYGGSSGKPASSLLLQDSLDIYDWYKETENDWVFLYAHSLGTGVAAYLSSKREVQSMVLEAPYSSLSDVAADRYPVFPVRSLFKHEMDNVQNLQGSTVPTLILHGEADGVVPIKYGRRLFETLNRDVATFRSLPEVGHNNLPENGSVEMAIDHFVKAF